MNNENLLSQDKKILTWNKESFEELVSSFTDNEISDMQFFLEHNDYFPIDVEGMSLGDLVNNYIHRWFYTDIEDGNKENLHTLFDVIMCIQNRI